MVVERTGVQWVEKTYKVRQNRKGRQVCENTAGPAFYHLINCAMSNECLLTLTCKLALTPYHRFYLVDHHGGRR